MKTPIIISAIVILLVPFILVNADEVNIWYGNLDGSPINADIGNLVDIDVYIQTSEGAYVSDLFLCLGADNLYFDSLLSDIYGELYPPYDEWFYYGFSPQYGAPPNPAGWSSQSVMVSARLIGGPWIYFEIPTRLLKMVFKAANDSLLVGDTAECLGAGLDPFQGSSMAGDTLGGLGYPVIESYSPVYFTGLPISIKDNSIPEPKNFMLMQNFPNPFNVQTTIKYALPQASPITIDIYDILGQKVETLVNRVQRAGYHNVRWNADDVVSGIYFYRIEAEGFAETRRMLLLK
jgi:hypothetical protein